MNPFFKDKKYSFIFIILFLFILCFIYINKVYLDKKSQMQEVRDQCRSNINQIRRALEFYKLKNGKLPSNLKMLVNSEYCPIYPPNRFVCPKNIFLNQFSFYVYTTTPISVSYDNRNLKIILFCKPEPETGYFNAITENLIIVGGYLNNSEKVKLIKYYDTLFKDISSEVVHFYTNPEKYINLYQHMPKNSSESKKEKEDIRGGGRK